MSGPILSQLKRNNLVILAQLTLKIDLLLALPHPHGGENFLQRLAADQRAPKAKGPKREQARLKR